MNLKATLCSKIIAMSFIALITNDVQSMEENCVTSGNDNEINTSHRLNPVENIINNNISDDETNLQKNSVGLKFKTKKFDIESPKRYKMVAFNEQDMDYKLSINNFFKNNNIAHNSVVYNSNDNAIRKVMKSIDRHPTDYEQQKLEGINILNNREDNQEHEKFLFSINDSNTLPQDNIDEIKNNIDTMVKDVVLDRDNYDDDVLYKNKTEEEKANSLCNSMMRYYNGNSEYIFNNNAHNNNCIMNKYDSRKTYIPFKLLQIMYNSIKKYDRSVAYKTINLVYNKNKDTVHDYFKEIYSSEEFDPEINKKKKGFLGSYNLSHIPNHKELDEQKGKALADYWEYANRSTKMFPSINVHYTDEYLKEAHKRWSNNIQYDLNNIIEKNNNGRTIDNILNYYARVANRSPNIYLSNDVIDFIYKKLGINDVMYFIDKFIKIKQQYLTEDDLPQGDQHNHPGCVPHNCHQDYGHFQNLLDEYPNGNIKEYKVNIYNQNCVACIFNSSDKYGNAGANRIIINNEKEVLYNRLMEANTTFNLPKWNINKYSKINYEGNKEYNTLFLYYVK